MGCVCVPVSNVVKSRAKYFYFPLHALHYFPSPDGGQDLIQALCCAQVQQENLFGKKYPPRLLYFPSFLVIGMLYAYRRQLSFPIINDSCRNLEEQGRWDLMELSFQPLFPVGLTIKRDFCFFSSPVLPAFKSKKTPNPHNSKPTTNNIGKKKGRNNYL